MQWILVGDQYIAYNTLDNLNLLLTHKRMRHPLRYIQYQFCGLPIIGFWYSNLKLKFRGVLAYQRPYRSPKGGGYKVEVSKFIFQNRCYGTNLIYTIAHCSMLFPTIDWPTTSALTANLAYLYTLPLCTFFSSLYYNVVIQSTLLQHCDSLWYL